MLRTLRMIVLFSTIRCWSLSWASDSSQRSRICYCDNQNYHKYV